MAAHKPIILVSADTKALDGYTFHAAMDSYVRSIAIAAQATPIIIPALADMTDFDRLLEIADGIVFTGSRSNVAPERYGQMQTERHAPFDHDRDQTTLPLITKAIERGIPLFAVCRGHQELNVALGGSIDTEIQDLPGRFDHRGGTPDEPIEHRFRLNHEVSISPFGVLSSILGGTAITVNSVHRQAISTLGADLNVEAHAADGTIEAVSVRGAQAFALGVQWHPEYWVSRGLTEDEPSTKLFEAFGNAARARQEARI